MQNSDVIRAWKDPDFRADMSAQEWSLMPQNPAGMVELTDEALDDVVGGDTCLCWSCDNRAPAEETVDP